MTTTNDSGRKSPIATGLPIRGLDPRGLTLKIEPAMDLAVGLTLAMRREIAGLSVEELADLTGLPVEELKDHESGNYPLPVSRAALLSEALGFDPGLLLGAARLGQRHGMIALIGRAPEELVAGEINPEK